MSKSKFEKNKSNGFKIIGNIILPEMAHVTWAIWHGRTDRSTVGFYSIELEEYSSYRGSLGVRILARSKVRILSMESKEYEEYRTPGIRILARSTTDTKVRMIHVTIST